MCLRFTQKYYFLYLTNTKRRYYFEFPHFRHTIILKSKLFTFNIFVVGDSVVEKL